MKLTYSIGEVITLESGWTGKVINILHKGHTDIRPPFHSDGHPILRGINGCLGTVHIIPSDWPIYYGDEVSEHEVKEVIPPKVSFDEIMESVGLYFSVLSDGTIGMVNTETAHRMLEDLYDAVEEKFRKRTKL
jgi:hypothetical protein